MEERIWKINQPSNKPCTPKSGPTQNVKQMLNKVVVGLADNTWKVHTYSGGVAVPIDCRVCVIGLLGVFKLLNQTCVSSLPILCLILLLSISFFVFN